MLNSINKCRKKILRERIEQDIRLISPKRVLDNGSGREGSWDHDSNIKIDKIDKIFGGDSLNLKFKNSVFDCVVFAGVIQYLEDPIKSIRECRRVLKKNGTLIISTINSNSLINSIKGFRQENFSFTQKGMKKILEKEKFKIISKDMIDFPIVPKERRMIIYFVCKKA